MEDRVESVWETTKISTAEKWCNSHAFPQGIIIIIILLSRDTRSTIAEMCVLIIISYFEIFRDKEWNDDKVAREKIPIVAPEVSSN